MQLFITLATLVVAIIPLNVIAAPAPEAYLPDVSPNLAARNLSSSYIIVLKEDTDEATFDLHRSWVTSIHKNRLARRDDPTLTGWTTKYVFGKFKGYAGAFDQGTIEMIRMSPEVTSQSSYNISSRLSSFSSPGRLRRGELRNDHVLRHQSKQFSILGSPTNLACLQY